VPRFLESESFKFQKKQDNFQSNKILMDIVFKVQQSKVWAQTMPKAKLFLYIFGRLECVRHSFAYVAHFEFLEISGFEPREVP
jgi:hypothetical protein